MQYSHLLERAFLLIVNIVLCMSRTVANLSIAVQLLRLLLGEEVSVFLMRFIIAR
jgi:hypothetical protein